MVPITHGKIRLTLPPLEAHEVLWQNDKSFDDLWRLNSVQEQVHGLAILRILDRLKSFI